MTQAILALNTGSSSVKFGLYEFTAQLRPIATGQVRDIGFEPFMMITHGKNVFTKALPPRADYRKIIELIMEWIAKYETGCSLTAAGHRIVHGGDVYKTAAIVTPQMLKQLKKLAPLAPLHQSQSLAGIKALAAIKPHLMQVACFDTAFHAGRDPLYNRYAVPRAFLEKGVRRYGFHGLSYEWIAGVLQRDYPELRNVIVAHLGSGASVCAMRNGISVDTSMGMTTLSGLPMGTRCGDLDPGAVLYLIKECGLSPKHVEHELYHASGLKALSGTNGEMKVITDSSDPDCAFAFEYFTLHIAQAIAGMAMSLGGMDAIVFTGGIGEHSEKVRSAVLDRLSFMPEHATLVIPTNEERVIAEQVYRIAAPL